MPNNASRSSGLDADILSALGITGPAKPTVAGSLADAFSDLPRSLPSLHRAQPDEHLVDALHREFDRVVADPSQLLGTADWPAHKARHHEPAPDFEALGALATPFVHLRDMVLPPLSIDTCIDGFDSDEPAGAEGLLSTPVPPEVLRLFAPETPLIGAMFGLPAETRRDHHQLTTGTAMRPWPFTSPAPTTAPQARHDPDAATP